MDNNDNNNNNNNDNCDNSVNDSTTTSNTNNSDSQKHKATSISAKGQPQLNSFLSKTYHMVNESDSSIISWTDRGETFTIYDVEAFANNILPAYFTHSKFSSFIRQLNFYGFTKLKNTLNVPSSINNNPVRFCHDYFKRDQPDLLYQIKRTTHPSSVQSKKKRNSHVESLRFEIEELRQAFAEKQQELNIKFETYRNEIEQYKHNLTVMTQSYQDAILMLQALTRQQQSGTPTRTFAPNNNNNNNMYVLHCMAQQLSRGDITATPTTTTPTIGNDSATVPKNAIEKENTLNRQYSSSQ